MHHCEELVELIEMDILFAIFGAQNKKILILQIKKRINMQVGPTCNSAMQPHEWRAQPLVRC